MYLINKQKIVKYKTLGQGYHFCQMRPGNRREMTKNIRAHANRKTENREPSVNSTNPILLENFNVQTRMEIPLISTNVGKTKIENVFVC